MTENQIKGRRFLRKVANIPIEIDSTLMELELMRTRAEGLSAIRYDKDRVQSSPTNTMEEAIIKLLDYADKLGKQHIELVDQRNYADELMEYLDDEQRDVVDMYFFQYKSFYQISTVMNYSEITVKRRYYDALEIIGSKLEVDTI